MRMSTCEISWDKSANFPVIYPPQFTLCSFIAIRTSCCFAHSSPQLASNEVRVPRTNSLPSPSFRFCLTADTLGVRLILRGYNPRMEVRFNFLVKQTCPTYKKRDRWSLFVSHMIDFYFIGKAEYSGLSNTISLIVKSSKAS